MISWDKILGLISIGIATILLAFASFDSKGFHLIRLDFNVTSSPSVDFAVLSFCMNVQDGKGTFCSKPKVGYGLDDVEILIDDRFFNGTISIEDIDVLIQILEEVDDNLLHGELGLHSLFATIAHVNSILKMVTKAFVVHIVAFAISGFCLLLTLVAVFGAVGPISCFSYVFLGFGIVGALISGVFDIVLFVIAKQKIKQLIPPIPDLPALQVHIGTVVSLEMISFVLLLVTPIALLVRRCCMPNRSNWRKLDEDSYSDRTRLTQNGGDYTFRQKEFDP